MSAFLSHTSSFSSQQIFFFFLKKHRTLALSSFVSILFSTNCSWLLPPLSSWNYRILVLHLVSTFQWFCKGDYCPCLEILSASLNFWCTLSTQPHFLPLLGSPWSIYGLLSLHSSPKCCLPGIFLAILSLSNHNPGSSCVFTWNDTYYILSLPNCYLQTVLPALF